jgi:hypothetical protein
MMMMKFKTNVLPLLQRRALAPKKTAVAKNCEIKCGLEFDRG